MRQKACNRNGRDGGVKDQREYRRKMEGRGYRAGEEGRNRVQRMPKLKGPC